MGTSWEFMISSYQWPYFDVFNKTVMNKILPNMRQVHMASFSSSKEMWE